MQGPFSSQRPGPSSAASSRGGAPGGRVLEEEDGTDLSDEDVREVGEEDSESTHLTLNGDESSGVSNTGCGFQSRQFRDCGLN